MKSGQENFFVKSMLWCSNNWKSHYTDLNRLQKSKFQSKIVHLINLTSIINMLTSVFSEPCLRKRAWMGLRPTPISLLWIKNYIKQKGNNMTEQFWQWLLVKNGFTDCASTTRAIRWARSCARTAVKSLITASWENVCGYLPAAMDTLIAVNE